MNLDGLFLSPRDIEIELRQATDEGRTIPGELRAEAERLMTTDLSWKAAQEQAGKFLDSIHSLAPRHDYPYQEPSDWRHIVEARPASSPPPKSPFELGELFDRLHGAWIGRACGCLLGKPVEGWHRERLHGYLKAIGNFPLAQYIRGDPEPETAARFDVHPEHGAFIDRVDHVPEDDDLNYTVISHVALQRHGYEVTSEQIAELWLRHIPILRTCTAERVAYRNLVSGVAPPHSGSYRNPYREMIGGQIRADGWGYVSPGDPAGAAELAWRDARISHVKNGIYGAMWVASMIAAAFVLDTPRAVVAVGLEQIPARSRLAEWIRTALDWHEMQLSYDEVIDRIHRQWDESSFYNWCHVIPNAVIVAIALLYSGGNFGKGICLAVQPGFDTDCNGATVGSVLGVMCGAAKIPAVWKDPINDTIVTGVVGYQSLSLADMARLSQEILARRRETSE